MNKWRDQVRRFVVVVLTLFSMMAVVSMAASAQPSGAGPGNSANAEACQNGGWATLARTEDNTTAFLNQGECVSYGAQGNDIVDLVVVEDKCAGNNFYEWRTTDDGRFSTSEECHDYVFSGGLLEAPVPQVTVKLTTFTGTVCAVYGYFRDFPSNQDFNYTVTLPHESQNYSSRVSRYGDAATYLYYLDLGETFSIQVTSTPTASVSYTCGGG